MKISNTIRNAWYRLSGQWGRDMGHWASATQNELTEKLAEIQELRFERDKSRSENRTLKRELASAKSTTPELEQSLREEIADLKFRIKAKQDEAMACFRESEKLHATIRRATESNAVRNANLEANQARTLAVEVDLDIQEALAELGYSNGERGGGLRDRTKALIGIAKEQRGLQS